MLTLSYFAFHTDVSLLARARDKSGTLHTLSVFDVTNSNEELTNDHALNVRLRAGHVYYCVSDQNYHEASLVGVREGQLVSPDMNEELEETLGHLKCLIWTGLINGPLDGTEEDYYA